MSDTSFFELVLELPNKELRERSSRLIGFDARYKRVHKDIELLISPDRLERWSRDFHGSVLPVCAVLRDRYPLVCFHGDVGTGKTATAEGIANRLATELNRDATLFKLSTRVRGRGLHGEMSKLIGEAFDYVVAQSGKQKMSFLIIDEADALASQRDGAQLHQEEKAGTNTLIQKIDGIRALSGRVLVFLCTNRLHAIDPAILRRAAQLEQFDRPGEDERRELLSIDLKGVDLSEEQMSELVKLTGPNSTKKRLGMTFSDLRARFLPTAVINAFPDSKLSFAVLKAAAITTMPSPSFPVIEVK